MIVSDGNTIRCIGAVIHDPMGRLLLVKRANEPSRGKWSLPGGRVEPTESDQSAVRREVREETGLDVTVGPLLGRILRAGPHGTYEIFDYSCWPKETDLVAGSDALDASWVTHATFATLEHEDALSEGLSEVLRSWNRLPRDA